MAHHLLLALVRISYVFGAFPEPVLARFLTKFAGSVNFPADSMIFPADSVKFPSDSGEISRRLSGSSRGAC